MMLMYLALLFVGSAVAQVVRPGKCPNVEVKPDFDVQSYLGKWYEAERYFAAFELNAKCVTATYSANENGTVRILNENISTSNGKKSSIEGYAFPKTSETAKLSVVFPSLPIKFEGNYWILDTDYTSFAVVWSCSDIGIASARFAWILTKDQQPSEEILNKAYAVLEKNKIERKYLSKTDQQNCP